MYVKFVNIEYTKYTMKRYFFTQYLHKAIRSKFFDICVEHLPFYAYHYPSEVLLLNSKAWILDTSMQQEQLISVHAFPHFLMPMKT